MPHPLEYLLVPCVAEIRLYKHDFLLPQKSCLNVRMNLSYFIIFDYEDNTVTMLKKNQRLGQFFFIESGYLQSSSHGVRSTYSFT